MKRERSGWLAIGAMGVTVLAFAAIILTLVVLMIAGLLGAGSTTHTCETIHWRGAQCEALRDGR